MDQSRHPFSRGKQRLNRNGTDTAAQRKRNSPTRPFRSWTSLNIRHTIQESYSYLFFIFFQFFFLFSFFLFFSFLFFSFLFFSFYFYFYFYFLLFRARLDIRTTTLSQGSTLDELGMAASPWTPLLPKRVSVCHHHKRLQDDRTARQKQLHMAMQWDDRINRLRGHIPTRS